MDTVPAWVITLVIEAILLCAGGTGLLLGLFWRNRQRLRADIVALDGAQKEPQAVVETLPTAVEPVADVEAAEETDTETEEAATWLDDATVHGMASSDKIELKRDKSAQERVTEEALDVEKTAEADTSSGRIAQDELDELISAQTPRESGENQSMDAETQGHMAALMDEYVIVEEQISALQQNMHELREEFYAWRDNSNAPTDGLKERRVPEAFFQEMEEKLEAFQHTRKHMMQEIRTRYELIGLEQEGRGKEGEQQSMVSLTDSDTTQKDAYAQEIVKLNAALEQHTADFQRIESEYTDLLNEYQDAFLHS